MKVSSPVIQHCSRSSSTGFDKPAIPLSVARNWVATKPDGAALKDFRTDDLALSGTEASKTARTVGQRQPQSDFGDKTYSIRGLRETRNRRAFLRANLETQK